MEIQRAHDVLLGVILKEVPAALSPETVRGIHAACDALCWVLEHDHNAKFGRNLAALESAAESAGFTLGRRNN